MDDARLDSVPFMKLKRFVGAAGDGSAKKLVGDATNKMAVLRIANENGISLEPLLNETAQPPPTAEAPPNPPAPSVQPPDSPAQPFALPVQSPVPPAQPPAPPTQHLAPPSQPPVPPTQPPAPLMQHLAQAEQGSSQVFLTGRTPKGLNMSCLGAYDMVKDTLHEDRCVYRQEKGECMLWHAGGAWYVGGASNWGGRSGFMSVQDRADQPDNVSAVWKVAGDGWHDAPEVKCASAAEFAAAAARSRADASKRVFLAGKTPKGRNVACLGAYDLEDGKLHNERHVYRQVSSK